MSDIHPVRAFYNRVVGAGESAGKEMGLASKTVDAMGHTVRQYGEALVTGGALGAIHAEAKHGLDFGGKMPIDAVVAGLGAAAGVAMADHPDGLGHDMRNVGATAAGIFAFRKTNDLLTEKKRAAGTLAGGTTAKVMGEGDPNTDPTQQSLSKDDTAFGEDPIVAAARLL